MVAAKTAWPRLATRIVVTRHDQEAARILRRAEALGLEANHYVSIDAAHCTAEAQADGVRWVNRMVDPGVVLEKLVPGHPRP